MTTPTSVPGRRALVVAYFFPPLGGVSTARLVSLLRWLPAGGWRSTVLTARGTSYPLRDPGGFRQVPGDLTVLRATSPEPAGLRRSVLRAAPAQPAAAAGNPAMATAQSVAALPAGSILRTVRRLAFFPDDQLAWIPLAVARALRRRRRERWDVIYSTSFPISAHVIAGLLHRLTGTPWVAEFRDPWVGNVLMARLPWLHRQLQRKLERWIVGSSARTVFVTPGLLDAYAARYPDWRHKFRVITNGYDPEELVSISGEEQSDGGGPDARFRLVYAGTLDRPREMAAFLGGLDLLVRRRPDVRRSLAVDFVGACAPEVQRVAEPYLAGGDLASIVTFHGFMSRTAALQRVRAADAALVMLGDGPGMSLFVSGKLFDAIGLNRQVLAMVPEGDVRRFLGDLDWGVVADPEPGSVALALEELLDRPVRAGRADPTGRFDRRAIAREFAAVLDEASCGAGTGR